MLSRISWYMLAAWLYPMMCYGFVLLSSAAAGAGAGQDTAYAPGGTWSYLLRTEVLLNEPTASGKDVGFQITAGVRLASVWKNPNNGADRLFQIELQKPQLYIKSRKAPAPEGFIEHSSPLEDIKNSPFLVHWTNGRIKSLYIPRKEPLSLVNLKKGIASLFQFQLLDLEMNETDSSGACSVTYSSTGPHTFRKTKYNCKSEDTPYLIHPDKLFSVNVESSRVYDYEMSPENTFIRKIQVEESHVMLVNIKPDAGNKVKVFQELTHQESSTVSIIENDSLEDVVQQITNDVNNQFTHETLITEREPKLCQDVACPSFGKLVTDYSKNYVSKNYGTLLSANAFIKTLNAARNANRDEIVKVLKKKQNKPALLAIYDLLGTAQTLEAHEAAMKQLRLTDEKHLDRLERYLWGLSMGSHPKLDIIKDLLNRYLREQNLGNNIQETLILAVASMTDKYIRNPHNLEKKKILQSVTEAIYTAIDNCDKKSCQLTFIRALKNLKSKDTVSKLVELALHSSDKSSVTAMKALRSFPPDYWTQDVIKCSEIIFFQIKKKHDSSARTLALDILLGTNPDEKLLKDLLQYLLSNDKSFEVKKYLLQKLDMIASSDPSFRAMLKKLIVQDKKIHNYSTLSSKGMSTALGRQFLKHTAVNGSMVSVQEMNSGLVKRGIFDVVLQENEKSCEMFSLGLFSGGLGSFISSDEEEQAGEEEVPTAGMELTMLGTQIRPFVFFTGQGELMGHVWSGTASESTPAFQINTLLHDHLEYIRLGPGFIAEYNLQTAISFNLAGEIQISLWNRNSHSLVNQNAAMMMNGLLRVDSSFVQSKVEFVVSMEPKLDLESDIEFGSGVAVCLRLKQPATLFKHNIYKVERIPGSKHSIRKAKYKKYEIPGRTYNLNQKNNEMCNVLMKNR